MRPICTSWRSHSVNGCTTTLLILPLLCVHYKTQIHQCIKSDDSKQLTYSKTINRKTISKSIETHPTNNYFTTTSKPVNITACIESKERAIKKTNNLNHANTSTECAMSSPTRSWTAEGLQLTSASPPKQSTQGDPIQDYANTKLTKYRRTI